MSKIDDLYKRAFHNGDYGYDENAWESLEGLLDDQLPQKKYSVKSLFSLASAFTFLFAISSSSIFINSNQKTPQLSIAKSNSPTTQIPTKINGTATSNGVKGQSNSTNFAKSHESSLTELTTKQRTLAVVKNTISTSQEINAKTPVQPEPKTSSPLIASNTLAIQSIKSKLQVSNTPLLTLENDLPKILGNDHTSPEAINNRTSLVKLKPHQFKVNVPSEIVLSSIQPSTIAQKTPKLKAVNHFYVSAVAGKNLLTNFQSLNVPVGESIGNVALVNRLNESHDGGVEFGLKKKGLLIRSGIGVKQHSMSYKLFYSHTKTWQEMNVNEENKFSHIDSSFAGHELGMITKGDRTFFGVIGSKYDYDSVYAKTYDTTYSNYQTVKEMDEQLNFKFQYVTVPVQIGYEMQFKHWFVNATTGINFNILTSGSGRIYSKEKDGLVELDARDVLNPVVMELNAAIGIGYNLNSNWALIAQPRVLTSLNTAFKEATPYATQYQGYGVNLNLRYSF